MSDVLTRRVVSIVERVEQLCAEAAASAGRERDAGAAELGVVTQRLEAFLRSNGKEYRPHKLARDLRFAFQQIKKDVQVPAAASAPVTNDVIADYEQLLERVSNEVQSLVRDVEQWSRKALLPKLFQASKKPKAPTGRLIDDLGTLAAWGDQIPGLRAANARTAAQLETQQIRGDLETRGDRAIAALSASVAQLCADLMEIISDGGLQVANWEDARWGRAATADDVRTDIRLGRYQIKAPSSIVSGWDAPATLQFPFDSGLVIDGTGDNRSRAVELARSLSLRLLAAVPPGKVNFTFVDPVALGQSVADLQHLADFDAKLVDTRPLTGQRDIEARLDGLSVHIETVISKYLRGQFDSIDEYNEVAGELAEPYRVLVVFDYPAAFSESAAARLLSLMENGPRCGLHTIVVNDRERPEPRDTSTDRLIHNQQRVTWSGGNARLQLSAPVGAVKHLVVVDPPPPIAFDNAGQPLSPIAELLVAVGEGSRSLGDEAVTLERFTPLLNRMISTGRSDAVPRLPSSLDPNRPNTWWQGTTAESAVAPLGKSGAQDIASLFFSSTDIAGGAIMVGLPRSGKTTSLHAAILNMCMFYGPDELELYLIDAKHGVEFKIYEELPHARMVSINSDREFSVAVLQSLDREIERRAELMKSRASGRANITEYRAATGEKLPRIVLVMDEFHEVFEEDDALGHRAFQAFSNIVRQGPFAGVHPIVASQTLSSMPALDRSTLQLLPERVAFMCNPVDADLVMGDGNGATKLLSKQGEGLFNPKSGEPSLNKPFRGLYVPTDVRDKIIVQLRDKADVETSTRRPRVFDGDAAAARTRTAPVDERLMVRLGEPYSLEASVNVKPRRARGSNVLIVGETDDEQATDLAPRGAVHSVLAAFRNAPQNVEVIDFIGDEGAAGTASLQEVCSAWQMTYSRARELPDAVLRIGALTAARVQDGDYNAPPALLLLYGVQRALSLAPFDPYDSSDGPMTAGVLSSLIQDGAEVGVHVVVVTDSLRSFESRIGGDLFQEFTLRIAGGDCSRPDLERLVDAYGRTPDLRRYQLLFADQTRGSHVRMRGYVPFRVSELPKRVI